MHGLELPPSSLQLNEAGPLLSWNLNVAEVWLVSAAGVASNTTAAAATAGEMAPRPSVATSAAGPVSADQTRT